jgi:SAM-dependent methyltransferase
MQKAWDRASKIYLERRGHDVQSVSYGNLAPSDDELQLLGDLREKRVLDIGCGGGQNAVACALAGANVVGIDLSISQLMAARLLADEHGVEIDWRAGDGDSITTIPAAFDLILAIQVLPYVSSPATLLKHAASKLTLGGRLIASFDHPIRNCFYDSDSAELAPFPIHGYFESEALSWYFDPGVPMQAHHFPLGQWVTWIREAGLTLEEMIEAPAPDAVCDELWPQDSPLAPLRNIPHSAILVASRSS